MKRQVANMDRGIVLDLRRVSPAALDPGGQTVLLVCTPPP
jgi:hypothetical protein